MTFIDTPTALVQFSNDGGLLAIAPDNNLIKVLDPLSGEIIQRLNIPRASVNGTRAIAFSPNDKYIAVGGLEERVDVFDLEDGSRLTSFETSDAYGSSVMVQDILFDQGGDSLIIASNSDLGGIAIWNYLDGSSSRIFRKPVNAIALASPSSDVALATWPTGRTIETDAPVVVIDIQSGTYNEIPIEGEVAVDVQIDSMYSDLYALVDNTINRVDMGTGKATHRDYRVRGTIVLIELSSTGVMAILSSVNYQFPGEAVFDRFYRPDASYQLTLVDTRQSKVLDSKYLVGVTDMDFSPDGSLLAVASIKEGVFIWEIPIISFQD